MSTRSLPGLLNFATSLGRVDDIQNQGPHLALTGLIEVADVSGLGSRRSGTDLADAIRVRARCAARAREWLVHAVAHLTFRLQSFPSFSPLFLFFIILPPAREKSLEGLLDGAGGSFSGSFSAFPHSRASLLVQASRLFHDHSSGF